jgi:hypothetical protein
MSFFISATVLLPQIAPPEYLAELIGYFTNRETRRMISRVEAPAISSVKPMVPKSIDFSSDNGYGLRAGPCGPAPLINLSGQSSRALSLLWLLCPLRLPATIVAFSQLSSFSFTSRGLIPPSVYYKYTTSYNFCQEIFLLILKKPQFSGVKKIPGKTRTVMEAV